MNRPRQAHECLAILLGVDRRGEQVQALDATLQHLIPSPFSGEGGIDGLKFRERKDGTAGHQPDPSLFQVATLGHDDQVALVGSNLAGIATDSEIRTEDGNRAAGQVIALTKLAFVDFDPERLHCYGVSSSSE
jgi:hypothetical protein